MHKICCNAGRRGGRCGSMRIIADENIFEPIIKWLRVNGHEVISIRGVGLSGVSDDEIYKKAVKQKLVILTMDKDFSRMLRFPPQRCGGIIVVKIYRLPVNETTEFFSRYFEELDEGKIAGKLVIITQDGIRVRNPRESKQ